MQTLEDLDFENDWKMINIQIGSNDMCGACNSTYMDQVTPEKFGEYVEAAVERIHANIPKVLVNLIGTFNVSQVLPLSAGHPAYCPSRKTTETDRESQLCSCGTTPEGLATMDKLVAGKYDIEKKTRFLII
jgi:phospholipase B1